MSQTPSEARVVANIAPKHYGVAASYKYDNITDAGQARYWSAEEEEWQCSRVLWYIEKGEELQRSRKIEFAFSRKFPPNPSWEKLQVTETLTESSLETRPVHPKEGSTRGSCSIKVDLSTVPEEQFQKMSRISTSDGSLVLWWRLRFTLSVTIQSGPMLFAVHVNGKEYGQALVEY